MKIKVLGPGCAKCHTLDKLVRETVKEMQIDAEVEYIQDMLKILDYNIMSTPALIIDEQVKSSGRVPNKGEIQKMISSALAGG
jgi:small redox-active disulfide protein 2